MATADNIKVPSGAIGAEQNLATWAGPYVTDMLGKAQALSDTGFQPYEGALTAGPSALQTQAFQGLGALTVPKNITQAGTELGGVAQKAAGMSYSPTAFQNTYQAPTERASFDTFGAPQAQQYMNPYLEAVLEPQRREAQRQADIARTQMQSRMAQAGAYGGSRQAIMEAEAQRNLQTQLGDITGKGYASAYESAQQQFERDQARRMAAQQLNMQQNQIAAQLAAQYGMTAQQAQEASKQFGASYGLDALARQTQALQAQGALGQAESQTGLANLAAQMQGGATQRGIEQEGLAADYAQFLRESQFPYEQLKFQQSMLAGLPIAATAYAQPEQDPFDAFLGGAQNLVGAIQTLYPDMFKSATATAPAATSTTTTVPAPPPPATVVPGATNMTPAPAPAPAPLIKPATAPVPAAPAPSANAQVFSQPSVIGGSGGGGGFNLGNQFRMFEPE
jgi:hypothetical protein